MGTASRHSLATPHGESPLAEKSHVRFAGHQDLPGPGGWNRHSLSFRCSPVLSAHRDFPVAPEMPMNGR